MVFEQGTSSYTNLPFAFYQITAALFLYRFLKERKRKDLLLSGIIFGLSAWTRSVSEPYFLACFLILIIYLPKLKLTEKLYLSVGFLLLYLVIGFPWQIYVRYLGVVSFSVGWMVQKNIYTLNQYPQNYFNIDALGKVVERLLTILADFKLFGAGGILFFLSFILSRRSIKKEKILILLIFLNLCFWILSIYGLGVVVSFRESWENILQDSMSRVFLGIYPLLLFYVAKTDLIFEIFDGKKK
jgi:4-amino-4-deoxy-L-arabinose transferase-like glycosyltransferase